MPYSKIYKRVRNNPKFEKLVSTRRKFALMLSLIILSPGSLTRMSAVNSGKKRKGCVLPEVFAPGCACVPLTNNP